MDQIHKVHKRGLVSVENILFVGFAEDISAIIIKLPRPWVEWVELLHLWLATLNPSIFFSETIIMYKYKSSQSVIDKLIQYIGRSGRCWGRVPDMQLTGSDVSGHYSFNNFFLLRAWGVPVGRRSGGRLATTLVATKTTLFSLFSFFSFPVVYFSHRRSAQIKRLN